MNKCLGAGVMDYVEQGALELAFQTVEGGKAMPADELASHTDTSALLHLTLWGKCVIHLRYKTTMKRKTLRRMHG